MFLLNVKAHYDSAHFLRNYHGKCEKLHGHHYVVEAGLARYASTLEVLAS